MRRKKEQRAKKILVKVVMIMVEKGGREREGWEEGVVTVLVG